MKKRNLEHIEIRIQNALKDSNWLLLEKHCRNALSIAPSNLLANRLFGFALHKQKRTEEATNAYNAATSRFPNDAELLINQANMLLEQARHAEAAPLLSKVCKLCPAQSVVWMKFAQCCYYTQEHEAGFEAAQKALSLAKTDIDTLTALNQRALHRRELGQVREAVRDCESAIAMLPGDPTNHSNRMLFMLADPQASAMDFKRAADKFAEHIETPFKPTWPTFESQRRDPWRRLKIGFISPDFRTHSVMYFIEGLIAQLDRRQFEVCAFYLYPSEDTATYRIRCHADQFVHLAGLDAPSLVNAVRDAKIDLLIDLAGHTGYNALYAMAQKLAPVQISWIGFPATTGLSAMDYKFTDQVTDPEGVEAQYSEQLYRLPTLFCCYRPLSRNPLWRYQPAYQVRPTPALKNGYITFGSCNNLGKVTDEVLSLWGRILAAVPGARLLIEGKNFEKSAFSASYRARCVGLGIDADRLDLVPLDYTQQYLTYHRIDISLDPFPLTGGTTTFDLLWMGTPLVSMEGDSFKSRLSTGILTYLKHSDWISKSPAHYLENAIKLASDVEQLNTTRLALRKQMEHSVLMREDVFALHFGEGLRMMWMKWLAQGMHPDSKTAQDAQIVSWQADIPTDWTTPPSPGIGLAPGVRIPLPKAHEHLEKLLNHAQMAAPSPHHQGQQIHAREWEDVTTVATQILCAKPHDPVALAVLAEVEHAHGHTDFAVTYLRYAQEALMG